MESQEENYQNSEQESDNIPVKIKGKMKGKVEKKTKKEPKQKKGQTQNVLSINTSKGTIDHQRPSFLKRWDGESNELEIFEQQYRKMSPMMVVYWRQKSQFMKGVMFVQLGKMEYFVYENDAILFHQLFGKQIGKFSKFLSVHLWPSELTQFTKKLYKRNIAIKYLQQVYDRKYKNENGIIKRQVKRFIHPGVALQYQIQQSQPSQRFLFSLFPGKQLSKIGVVVIDTSTHLSYVQQIPSQDIRRILNKFKPVQIVVPKYTSSQLKRTIKQVCNPFLIQIDYFKRQISKILKSMIKDNQSQIFDKLLQNWKQHYDQPNSVQQEFLYYNSILAIDLLSEYFKKLNVWEKIIPTTVFQLVSFSNVSIHPVFDSQVYENLQVFDIKNQQNSFGQTGTLFCYLNQCKTLSGTRKLRQWISSPLTNQQQIKQRQQCIVQLMQYKDQINKLHAQMKFFPDFQSKISSVYHWIITNPRDISLNIARNKNYDQNNNPIVVKVKQIKVLLQQIQASLNLFEKTFKNINFKSKIMNELVQSLFFSEQDKESFEQKKMIEEKNNNSLFNKISNVCTQLLSKIDTNRETGRISPKSGIISQYDKQSQKVQSINKKLQDLLESYKQKLGYKKIKYVSIKARNEIQIPKEYQISKDTSKWLHFSSFTAKVNRYTSLDSQNLSEQIIEHQIQMDNALIPFLNKLIDEFSKYKFSWNKFCQIISEMDVYCSLAYVSNQMQIKCVPQFIDKGLQYQDGIHVGLQQTKKDIVRNSVKFKNNQTIMVITGPNMGGKSTILRQTCLLAIIAQIGCLVPAKKYKSKVFDQFFCRIGASDRIHEGKSTFYVQIQQTKHILQKATKDSLVIIDQLGRGTSTFDGVSIAAGCLSQFINIGCISLFSTHYSIVADEFQLCPEVRNKTVDYKIQNNKLIFKYQLVDGIAQRSFALNIAKLVSIPESILQIAQQKSLMITKQDQSLKHLQEISKKFNDLLIMTESL